MSSEHCGYIVQINELHPHSNADRLQIAIIFGQSVIVDLKTKIGDFGVYFPIDLQLSKEYCEQNNLVRKRDENGNNIGGYLDPDKRNIRAMKLRGEKSEGLFMPLESLAYTGETKFSIGDKISIINGHEICCKYIPRHNPQRSSSRSGNKTRKYTAPIAPLFREHADTEQLVYNLDAFRPGDLIEITLKMHGTSGRTGYLPKFVGYKSRYHFWNRLLQLDPNKLSTGARKFYDKAVAHADPIYDWGYVTGTRRVVIDDFSDGGYYGSNAFREQHAKKFEGKLHKGETAYYEIVGFTDDGTPIMPQVNNNKISDKEFSKMYGPVTTFSYGCNPEGQAIRYGNDDFGAFEIPIEIPQSDIYVYRITSTNEDGDVIEYPPDYVRYRCEQMGVKCVPLLWSGIIPNDCGGWNSPGEYVKEKAEMFYDGPDPIGKTHIREGVVIRIINRPKFCAYKHKNWFFKCLEGIAKDLATAPDLEEAQELLGEDS